MQSLKSIAAAISSLRRPKRLSAVIPVQAGIQVLISRVASGRWMPACAGLTNHDKASRAAVQVASGRRIKPGATAFAYLAAGSLIAVLALYSAPASAWDTRWQFKPDSSTERQSSGTRVIEMQKKFDHDPLKTFKGTTDGSSGYTVMRNLDGGAMRGYINKDGPSLLRDHNGRFHYVNPRWQSYP